MNKLGKKFWWAMLIFGIMGQVAWVVENMYFNVFIIFGKDTTSNLRIGCGGIATPL